MTFFIKVGNDKPVRGILFDLKMSWWPNIIKWIKETEKNGCKMQVTVTDIGRSGGSLLFKAVGSPGEEVSIPDLIFGLDDK